MIRTEGIKRGKTVEAAKQELIARGYDLAFRVNPINLPVEVRIAARRFNSQSERITLDLAEARPPKSTLRQHRLQIRSAPPVLCRPHFYVPQKIWNQGACRYRNQRQQKSLSDRPCIHDVTSHLNTGLIVCQQLTQSISSH